MNLEREERLIDSDLAPEIRRDIDTRFFSVEQNCQFAFVSVCRREQTHFRAGAAAFVDVADLFVRRFAERENGFL